MRLIVGLGNPGSKYVGTRHNIGFRALDLISSRWEIKLSEKRPKAILGIGSHLNEQVALVKPRTFMNNSGEALRYLTDRFGTNPNDILVIYDEMALPVGKIRLRASGSDAGHNGIKSIISALGTDQFPRLRLGIGRPDQNLDQISHVIGKFSDSESPLITKTVATVVDLLDTMFSEGLDKTMNVFN
jgi:PTH1 family peptidyl-tRNA hydrolase